MVSTITLLDKERRCSPSRGTGAHESFLKCLVDFLLKFKEFMWRHLVRTLGNRDGTRFKSMTNSTSLDGGIPDRSSGKTSGKTRTTGTFSIRSRGETFKAFIIKICVSALRVTRVVWLIISPEGWKSWTDLVPQYSAAS